MLRSVLLCLIVGIIASQPAPQASQVFVANAKDAGVAMSSQVPAGDFDIRLRLTWNEPGSVLDTVGLNEAKKGSFALNVIPNEHVEFRVWDGGQWVTVDGGQKVAKGVETPVRVVRRGRVVHIETNGTLGPTKDVGVSLTGDRAYLGDFPGDQDWAPPANPKLGFLGRVSVEYVGAPSALPSSIIHDPIGRLTEADVSRLKGALNGLAAEGIPLAVTLLSSEDTAAKTELVWLDGDFQSSGLVPPKGGILAFGKSSGWVYRRSSSLNAKLPLERVQEEWGKLAGLASQNDRIPALLEALLAFATSDSTPPEPAAFKVLATGKVGPAGGTVEAPGELKVRFPEGSLKSEDELTITKRTTGARGAIAYSVTLKGGYRDFAKPITLDFTVPPGHSASQYEVVQRLSDNLWDLLPVQSGGSTITASTYHFTDVGLLEKGREYNITVRAGEALGAAVVLTGLTLGSTPIGAPWLIAGITVSVVVGGAYGAHEYDSALFGSLNGPIKIDGFDIYYEPSLKSGGYALLTKDGYPIMKKASKDLPDPAHPLSGIDSIEINRGGKTVRVPESDIILRDLPPDPIASLAVRLSSIRAWFSKFGTSTSKTIPVLVTLKVPEKDFGNWDKHYLCVNARMVGSTGEMAESLDSTLVHEYWHAICTSNGYKESFPGSEDSLAVGFESIVLAGKTEKSAEGSAFLKEYQWTINWPSYRTGLLSMPPGETEEQHGYHLYAWAKYLYHVWGADALRKFITEGYSTQKMRERWFDFADQLFFESRTVKDPVPFITVFGDQRYTYSGLHGIGFQTGKDFIFPIGYNQTLSPNPLSLHPYSVVLTPPAGAPPAALVVRREHLAAIQRGKSERFMAAAASEYKGSPAVASGFGSVVIPAEWSAQRTCELMYAVPGPVPSWQEDPVICYRLAAPSTIQVSRSDAGNEGTKVTVTTPIPKVGIEPLNPSVLLAGFRLYGQMKGGTRAALADLLFPTSPPFEEDLPRFKGGSLPKGTVLLGGQQLTASVVLPKATVAAVEAFGLATIDAEITADQGPLTSSVTMEAGTTPGPDILPTLQKTTDFTIDIIGVVQESDAPSHVGTQMHLTGTSWGPLNHVTDVMTTAKDAGRPIQQPTLTWNGSSFSLTADTGALVRTTRSAPGTSVTTSFKRLRLSGTYDPATNSVKGVTYTFESSTKSVYTPDPTYKPRSSLEGPNVASTSGHIRTTKMTFDSVPLAGPPKKDYNNWSLLVSFALDGKSVRQGCTAEFYIEDQEPREPPAKFTRKMVVGPAKGYTPESAGAYVQFYIPK